MSDHSRALVPIETWAFNSPDLGHRGISVDLGHLAESLIYYDQVFLNVSNQPQFAKVLSWFVNQDRLGTLLSLVSEGALQVYEYSFASAPIYDPEKDRYMLMNIQDENQKMPDSFERRFLYHKDVEAVLPKGNMRRKLYQVFRGRVIEVKAEQFGSALEEARCDFTDADRNALTVQAFIDEVYGYRRLGRPPKVECSMVSNVDGSHSMTVNIDFNKIAELAGVALNWNKHSPLAGSAASCRFLQSASALGCDLFLAKPISRLVGNKLYESARAVNKPGEIIETLQSEVEFPDIRALVNDGRLGVDDILHLRAKSKRFRQWLQDEADRDRNAFIAYHHEVAKETGFAFVGKKVLNLFGFVGGAAIGAALGAGAGPGGSVLGAAAGGAVSWAADLGSKVGAPWRPVVFGNWLREQISELDRGRK